MGASLTAMPPQWTGDLIGLRTLYNNQAIVFSEFKGNHLRFNDSWWDDEASYFEVHFAGLP